MRKYVILTMFLAFSLQHLAQNMNMHPDSIPTMPEQKEGIIFVNVLNPLLYGKAGAGYTFRNLRRDIYVYGDYIFSPGFFGTTIYLGNGQYGVNRGRNSPFKRNGFSIGAQFRLRDGLLSKPYAKYLNKLEQKTSFYAGFGADFTYMTAETDFDSPNYNSFIDLANGRIVRDRSYDISAIEPKVNGLVGWSFTAGEKIILDLHFTAGLGYSMISGTETIYDTDGGQLNVPLDQAFFVIHYQLGFMVGFKH